MLESIDWSVTALVLAIAAIVFYRLFVPSGQAAPAKQPEPMLFTTFTPKSLYKYNGNDDPRVLLSIKNTVFDVTRGKSFYGPGGPYANFAGRDASRGLSKNSFDEDMLTDIDQPIDTLADLTADERKALDDWYEHFKMKYDVVGELVELE